MKWTKKIAYSRKVAPYIFYIAICAVIFDF